MSKSDETPSFEAALARLEAIVQRLEEGEVTIDDAIVAFEEGLGLLKQCRSTLEAAELRVRELLEPGEEPPAGKGRNR